MLRPILGLWPYWWRALIPVLMVAALAPLSVPIAIIVWVCGTCPLRVAADSPWLVKLTRHVRRFRTVRAGHIVLHYAEELGGTLDVPGFLRRCEEDLVGLADRFAAAAPRRITIYLFADHETIRSIFGPNYSATALFLADVIVIADNCYTREVARHEMAHLLSNRWNRHAPPLLSEGLSVHAEGTRRGRPIDDTARPLIRDPDLTLRRLLDPVFFFGLRQVSDCYVLAGSFTGFLIRRYGFTAYKALYRACDSANFRRKFEQHIGVSLEKAQWQWRNELTVLEVLRRRSKSNIRF